MTRYKILYATMSIACALLFATDCKQPPAPAADTERLVTLSGGVTEIVFALGAGDRVVGADTSSVYPAAARKLPQLGYHRKISAEGILSLNPTLVLASEDSGPPEALKQIRAAGVEVRTVPEKASVDAAEERVSTIAAVLDRKAKGDELLARLKREIQEARAGIDALSEPKPRAVFIYIRGGKVLLAAGKYSPGATMLELSGAENAMNSFYGYKPLAAESLVAAKPDVLVLLKHGVASVGGIDEVLKIPGVALTPAGKQNRFVIMDDLLFSGFTHRLGLAIRELSRGIHPELSGQTATADTTHDAR